jgi:hypothetical protein
MEELTMPTRKMAPTAAGKELFDDLRRLVEALDRRVPHLERLDEAAIAREAADLRKRAVALMQAIEAARPPKS